MNSLAGNLTFETFNVTFTDLSLIQSFYGLRYCDLLEMYVHVQVYSYERFE